MKIIVNRSKWLRGEGADASELYRSSDQKMCCLGFAGITCGYALDELEDNGTPAAVDNPGKWPGNFFDAQRSTIKTNSDFINNAMLTNDNKALTDTDREADLIKIFAAHEHEIVFEG